MIDQAALGAPNSDAVDQRQPLPVLKHTWLGWTRFQIITLRDVCTFATVRASRFAIVKHFWAEWAENCGIEDFLNELRKGTRVKKMVLIGWTFWFRLERVPNRKVSFDPRIFVNLKRTLCLHCNLTFRDYFTAFTSIESWRFFVLFYSRSISWWLPFFLAFWTRSIWLFVAWIYWIVHRIDQ
jgi:hypothetical protein